MRITGERPVDGVTPDGLVALHTAGYREVRSRTKGGTMLDVGCGVGFGSSELQQEDVTVVGIDYDHGAVAEASRRWGPSGLQVVCMDGGRLAFGARSFDWVCSSHIIEHFSSPEDHVSELRRVLKPGGTTYIFTPNAPADLENPFHLHLFEAVELGALLRRHFNEVWVGGHDATECVKRDFETRRQAARRLLALDFLDLRHRMPRSWYIGAYSVATRLLYRLQARHHAGGTTNITPADFFVTERVDSTTLNLFAVASQPRR